MKERPMKHNRRRRSPGKPRGSPTVLDRINTNVAGIDCGSAEHLVAVPPDRDPTPVQSFQTFTSDLRRLADWLAACRVTSVAMEATGVYWIPIYEILEAQGFEVLVVNARHLKNVPGRTSDVSDCEWIRELHSVGLLRGSFRPPAAIVALRAYLRHRQTVIESAGTYIQRMQKALVQMNLQLPLVSEIGTDMSRWATDKHFTSWLTLAPKNKISGGRLLSSRTQPSANRAAAILRMTAMSLGRTQTALGGLLSPVGRPNWQAAGHYRHCPQTRHPGLSCPERRTHLPRPRSRRLRRPAADAHCPSTSSARGNPGF
jgi:hypothetical protein